MSGLCEAAFMRRGAHMVFVDRIQIGTAVRFTALRLVLVFPTPSF